MSSAIAESREPARTPAVSPGNPGLSPPRPTSLRDAGLTLSQLSSFILKSLYLNGSQAGCEISRELRLPYSALEETLQFLEDQRCLNVTHGEAGEAGSRQFALTELGRVEARDALTRCRYFGPVPVSLSSYVNQCRRQRPETAAWTDELFAAAFQHLVIPTELLDELGPAICGGGPILLHGPPGNGKTVIARALGKLVNLNGSEIYVPYAVFVENSIVTVFDPSIHQTTDDIPAPQRDLLLHAADERTSPSEPDVDLRWRRVRRPVVIAGGELTLNMLDLRHHESGGYYTAPQHMKANGGLFVIDDFGRQPVTPGELLNRWILPLEEGIDYLTLTGGRSVAVPSEQLVVFSTHLNPHDLVDETLLRRIRHKIRIPAPSRETFEQIFQNCCQSREFTFDRRHVDLLFAQHYNRQRLPRSSDPQDLLEIVASVCRFRSEEPRLDGELLTLAAERFFRDV